MTVRTRRAGWGSATVRLLLPAAVAAVVAGASAQPDPGPPPVRAHLTGPPPGHTGGFGEPTCQICHEGDALNAFGGSVTLQGLPGAWIPGERYHLTVLLRADETGAAGFQLSARFAEGEGRGRPAGVLAPVSPRVAITEGETGQPYAHHTEEGTRPPDSSGSSWMVEWTAPEDGGPVVFHLAANSGNGDNSPLLDLVYVTEVAVPGPATR